jgi:cytoskeleton protein RodZ
VLRFSADSWVQIHQKDGGLIYQQNNPAGSEKTLEGLPPFAVVIGNAPGVTMTYDGQPIDLRAHYKVDVARFTLE